MHTAILSFSHRALRGVVAAATLFADWNPEVHCPAGAAAGM
jgi:hypothetical protein